ncbi:MAG: Protein phosphatase 1F, partial [Paramarteilia canceri]
MTSKSNSTEAGWADLKDKLELASTGLGKNKRSWIFRRTPKYFESQNAKIELTAWLRCLFESSHIILELDKFLELNNKIWSLFSDKSVEKCNTDHVENKLESSGPLGEVLLRAMSDSMKNCEEKVDKKDRHKSAYFEDENQSSRVKIDDKDVKSTENESKDTDGLKYFDLIVGYLKSHFDQIKDQYANKASEHYLDQSVYFFDHKNGKRAMKDRICIIEDLGIYCESELVKNEIMLCVFDGHRGSECSDFLKTYAPFMWPDILESTNNKNEAIIEIFENLDQIFLAKAEFEGISAGAVGVISILDSNNHLFTGWIGDCEAHLITTNGNVRKLVKPHKLSDPGDIEI